VIDIVLSWPTELRKCVSVTRQKRATRIGYAAPEIGYASDTHHRGTP
jgi:hypothetical protein